MSGLCVRAHVLRAVMVVGAQNLGAQKAAKEKLREDHILAAYGRSSVHFRRSRTTWSFQGGLNPRSGMLVPFPT